MIVLFIVPCIVVYLPSSYMHSRADVPCGSIPPLTHYTFLLSFHGCRPFVQSEERRFGKWRTGQAPGLPVPRGGGASDRQVAELVAQLQDREATFAQREQQHKQQMRQQQQQHQLQQQQRQRQQQQQEREQKQKQELLVKGFVTRIAPGGLGGGGLGESCYF